MNDFDLTRRLRDCLLQLTEGKATERKKCVEDLKTFLEKPVYQQYLNRNSGKKSNDAKHGGNLTWKIVFSKIKYYIEQESQKFRERENSNESLSATVKMNITRDKRKCSDLFRTYVKAIDLNQQYEMSKLLMDHILAVLHDSFTRNAFGVDYSGALDKHILSNPLSSLNIPASSLDDAILIYCKIIKTPPPGWDRSSTTLVLLHLLMVRSNVGALDTSKLLDFFMLIFDAVKSEKISNHHENLLKSVLLVCQTLGVDHRLKLCQLGESIMLPLLQLWKTRPSETCTDLMLEFICFQLAIHHPRGAADKERGARAADWSVWKSQLLNLYKVVVVEIDELCEKNKYSSSKETVLKPIFISVVVEVCAQVFSNGVTALDVTQMSSTFDSSMSSKKRRIEVCFRTFIDSLSSSKIVPWLQIISAFIVRYPEMVSLEDAEHLFDTLIELNLSCNQFETKNWLLYCFQSFVQAFASGESAVESNFQWQRLWDLGVKSVALMHQCQEAAHKLLSTLLFNKLITPKVEFYKLYIPGSSNHVTSASLRTLRIFLEKYPALAANYSQANFSQNCNSAATYETLLLEWLFSRESDDNSPFQVISADADEALTEQFACVLTMLCLKNNEICCSNTLSVQSVTEKVNWIADMEEALLKISFDLPINQKLKTKENSKVGTHPQVLNVLIWEKILDFFIGISSNLFEEQTVNNQVSASLVFIRHAAVFFEIFQTFYFHGVIKDADLSSNHFISYLRRFLNNALEIEIQKDNEKLVGNAVFLLLKDFLQHIVQVFKKMQELYGGDVIFQRFTSAVWNAIPPDILKYHLNFCLENVNETKPAQNGSVSFSEPRASSSSQKRKYDPFDDDDDDMEVEIECIEPEAESEDFGNFVDPANTASFQQQMQSLEILCEYCSCFCPEDMLHRSTDSVPQVFIKKLLSIISAYSSTLKKTSDIHLILVALKCLLLSKHLEDQAIEVVMNTMRILLNQFSMMQSYCQSILELFPLLFHHFVENPLAATSSSSSRTETKSRALYLLRILSNKELERKGSLTTSYMLSETLFTLLKMEHTIKWPSKSGSPPNIQNGCEPENVAVINTFIKFLDSPFSNVRIFVATNINSVISEGAVVSFYELTCAEMMNFLLESENSEEDYCVNKTSTFFYFLYNLIIHFPCFEKESLFLICKMIKTEKIDRSVAVKVLSQLSGHLGYSSTKDFVSHHLMYIFYMWTSSSYMFEDFPFMLLELDSFELFVKEFYRILVPVFFTLENVPSISKTARILQLSDAEVITSCLPCIKARMMLDYNTRTSKFTKAKALLASLIPLEESERVLLSKLDEFVICVLSMLKEPRSTHFVNCQPPETSSISFEELKAIFLQLMQGCDYKGSFTGLLNQKADCVQNILLSLSVVLSKALRPHDEWSVLHMYHSFLQLIHTDIGPSLKSSCFVIKEIVFTLMDFLTDEKKSVKQNGESISYCCDILHLLCSSAMVHFKEVIGDFLPVLVSTLAHFVEESASGKKVLYLLNYLVIETETLAEYIPYLDPFPNKNMFQSLINKFHQSKYKNGPLSLEQEISIFLKSCQMMTKASIEGLQHLHHQLKSRQNELLTMLNLLKRNILFSEDVKSSLLHQLICKLASLCTSESAPFKVQETASDCLSAIGPIAFSSVVLQPSSNVSTEGLNALQLSYATILNLLTSYIFDKRIDLKVTASKILKELFETKTAYAFNKAYQEIHPNNDVQKYASPFFDCQNVKNLRSKCQYPLRKDAFEDISLWLPEAVNHSDWITNLVCTIIESGLTRNAFYEGLVPICKQQVSFCEKILPYLIHSIFLLEDDQAHDIVTKGIDAFFSHFSLWMQGKNGRKRNASSSPEISFQQESVRIMLSVVHHIWLNPRPKNERNVLKDFWLNINYLEVAHAAQYCSAYFTAILYTELWCDKTRESMRSSDLASYNSDSSGSLDCSPLSFIGSQGRDKASLIYDILLDTYSQIGDSDAICGCEVVASDSQAIIKHSYLIDKKWDSLLKLGDSSNSQLAILQALQQNHLNGILQGYIQSLQQNQDEELLCNVQEYQCEAAWRMGQWDLNLTESSLPGFQECLYKSQQSLIGENTTMFSKFIASAKKTQLQYLKHTSLEAARNILPALSRIQMLSVMEDFSKMQETAEKTKDVLKQWELQEEMPYEDFEFVEPISWLKCILLKHQVDTNIDKQFQSRNSIIEHLKKMLENLAERSRNEMHLEIASNAINLLRKLPCMEEEEILCWQIEEAKILWTKKECGVANKILKSTLPYMEKFSKENPQFLVNYGQALTLRGKWLAETCNENSAVITRDYLEKALSVFEKANGNSGKDFAASVSEAHLALARYSDAQYQIIINYEKSTAYQTKQVNMANSKEKAKQLKSKSSDLSEDQKKLLVILSRQTDIDQVEMKTMAADKKRFLEISIISYIHCLKGSNTHDLWIFRLISLWFQNFDSVDVNSIIKDRISQLQTYKFLPLMYQLAARMGSQATSAFTNTLMLLIKSITLDHPHHALPMILALSNADKDPADSREVTDQTVYLQQAEVPAVKERMNAAKKILASLQKTKIGQLIKNYSDLCDAYISLAYYNVDKTTKREKIPEDQALLKFRNLTNIPIFTEDVKVDRSCEYADVTGIHSFKPEFRMCGGLTLPKVIKCVGMDGKEREQLVKGRDDLRQDAVMQQVFNLVNYLLKEKRETRLRKLHIRTYKVVPVSRRSGVIQWCEGTQVLSQYLVGPKGAHVRYYPKMATPSDCRNKMLTIAKESRLTKKRQIFDSICADFPPVFRYFFLESFPEPSSWFERRQSYTKSVAASSIVGYILGLGDRHVNNILIDKNTAEVVHIDFGIAFEKGRILATPETVPFRLTRDIVDGMGINGVEGTFKKCCEKTLDVMRNSQDVLLTILEVLLHDPLYEWSVPAGKSLQKATSNPQNNKEVNALAERALMRLQQKLQGLEEGVAMSTEGQVNLLVQQARDPNNLCRIYVGWQPYL